MGLGSLAAQDIWDGEQRVTPAYGDRRSTIAQTEWIDSGPKSRVAGKNLAGWRPKISFSLALAVLLIASRLPLTPRYLVTFDEINFALSLRHFNPALHQPQPPGDPLFVFLIKLLSFLTPHVEALFFVSGVLLSLAALVLLGAFGEDLLGPGRGIVAALLLLFNPAFWLSALTNPVRLGYAVGAPAVAWCVYKALRRDSKAWFVLSAAILAFVSGFRPSLGVQLAPLLLCAAFRLRPGWKTLCAASLLSLAAAALWLVPLVAATGGWRAYFDTLVAYSYEQTQATSPLMGARLASAARMAWEALEWSCLGSLAWLWALPLARKRQRSLGLGTNARRLLLWWFIPGLAFYALFHVGDPDHTLEIIPVICLVGAAVLSAFMSTLSMRARTATILCAVLLNVFLFFKPITKTSRASTYTPVRWIAGYMSGVIDTIAGLQRNGGVTVVFEAPITGWRNVSYYLPEARVLVIRTKDQNASEGWRLYRNQSQNWKSAGGLILLPACRWLAWVDPVDTPTDRHNAPLASRTYPVSYTRAAPGETFQYHGYRFIATQEECPSQP